MLKEELLSLRGQLVKVCYQDGDHLSICKGDLVEVDEDFVKVRSLRHTYLIRTSAISKIVFALEPASNFESFAKFCPYRVDDRSPPVCSLHESSPGDCEEGLCARWEKRKEGVGHVER